jgi:putative tricarboxylic transport membrane protein
MNSRNRPLTLSGFLFFLALVCLSAGSAAQTWAPERHVELVVPQRAGGSLDLTARTLQRLWTEMKLVPVPTAVVNRAGGEHAVAYNFIRQNTSDPHFLSLAVPVIFSNHISGVSAFSHRDVTPVALLTTEYYVFVVAPGSSLKTGHDFVDALRKDAASVSIGVTSVLQRIAAGLVLRSANVNVKPVRMVVFTGGQTTAVAGGHVDVAITSLAQALPHIENGKLRAIAVGSPARMPGLLAGTPTWQELGYRGAVCQTWRAVIAPKDITAAQLAYWEGVLRRVTDTDEFRAVAEKQRWRVTFKGSADVQKMMNAEYDDMKSVMTSLGLVK